MRKWTSCFCIVVLALSVIGFTWEGKLDPNEFNNWKTVKQWQTGNLLLVVVKNPDESSPIEKVALFVNTISNDLLAYRYFEYSKPYSFVFDSRQDKYVQDSTQGCMKCHQTDKEII